MSSEYWARVRAPIGAGDGTVPPYNFRDGGAKKCDAWRWADWDGDALIINEYGCVHAETECFVQLSAAQWAEVAVVAAHIAPVVAKMEERAPSLPRFEIDPNVRVNNNQTYARLDGSEHEIGDDVILFESEEGIEWDAKIASYSFTAGLVYFDVEWESGRRLKP